MTREQETRMEELISVLKEAAEHYYNGEEIMSNKEYDSLYDELVSLEKETGIIKPASPTQQVGAVVESLKKVTHEYPALSLDKTKDLSEMQNAFEKGFKKKKAEGYDIWGSMGDLVIMWKLDGSTVVATYEGGKLITLATRGNGEVGSDITHNAPFIKGLPQKIDYDGKLIVRGEALMSYKEFNRINEAFSEDEKYKNPRNLANATVQMLDSNELKNREIHFMAHALVYAHSASGWGKPVFLSDQFAMIEELGFDVVPREVVNYQWLTDTLQKWTDNAKSYEYPVDGLVVAMEDCAYSYSLPGTAHNPNIMSGYALKWEDETKETILRDIEWSPSRTGLLNPVAVFDPVELEGTTVTRASLHNVSYIKDLNLLPGDKITVYKANMIIPQLDKNLDANRHGPIDISLVGKYCPCCKQKTEIVKSDVSNTLVRKCTNPDCSAKKIGAFVHFCERDCVNIEGMSEATITTFVKKGFLKSLKDLFHLDRYKAEIEALDGFGSKSYDNIINAVNKARSTDFVSFIHSLGIPNVGKGQAKLLKPVAKSHHDKVIAAGADENGEEYSKNYVDAFLDLVSKRYNFTTIEGIGQVINDKIYEFLDDERISFIYELLDELTFTDVVANTDSDADSVLSGKTFVITGSLNHFSNRDALVSEIEKLGGKVSGSVSKNTDYLINNDVTSTSGKNKKAKELGVEIISEDALLSMMK